MLSNLPGFDDIATLGLLLEQNGLSVADVPEADDGGHTVSVGGDIANSEAPYDIVSKMRASILVLGPLLARVGEARVSLGSLR